MAGSAVSVGKNKGFLRKAWRAVCSIRLAVVLLSAIAVVSLLGTLFPQTSWEVQADDVAHMQWVSAVKERYGTVGELYRLLGLFNVYSSPLFLLLLAGLLANGIACTVDRLRPVWRTVTARPRATRPDSFYERAGNRATLKVPSIAEARKEITSLLSKHRYRLLTEEQEGVTYISGRKNRFAKIGTLISHSALILVALGVVWSSHSAWREPVVILGPGQVYDAEHGHNFQVRHEGFEIDWYPEGPPKDYRSHLVVLEGGSEVARKTIRVNDPLTYRGVTFYLSSSGPALQVRGWDSDGQPLLMQSAPDEQATRGEAVLNFSTEGDESSLYLPTLEVTLHLILRTQAKAEETLEAPIAFLEALQKGQREPLFSDYVHQGDTVQLPSARLQFISSQYSVLQVVSDPGFVPLIGASFLGMGGLLISFYFYPSRVWVKLTDKELVLTGSAATHRLSFEAEFAKLVMELEDRLR